MTTLKVKITKDILRKSMMCGVEKGKLNQAKNCAIALAIREIFPNANILTNTFSPFGFNYDLIGGHNGSEFIKHFDGLKTIPEKRLELPETEVELYISDKTIEKLNENIDWKEIVNNSELLTIK